MNVLSFIFATGCLLAASLYGLAQDNTPFLGVKGHTGFIIPHTAVLQSVADTNPWGVSLEGGRVLKTAGAWASCNCFTKVGLEAAYFNYQNPQELGASYNLIIFGEPYIALRGNWSVTLRGAVGVSYLTKVYDEVANPTNLFFSTPLNFLGAASLTLDYRVLDRYVFRLSANYNHISNGGRRAPNKGMNFPTVSLGVEKHFGDRQFPTYAKRPGLRERNWYRYIFLSGSRETVKADSLHQRSGHLNTGLEAGFMRSVSNINALSGGFELYVNGAWAEAAQRQNEKVIPVRSSLTLGHALVFGKFSFTQQLGYHLHQPSILANQSFFQRYALYYRLGRWLNAGISLQARGPVADYMDIRMGARW